MKTKRVVIARTATLEQTRRRFRMSRKRFRHVMRLVDEILGDGPA